MSIYVKIDKAFRDKDADAYLNLSHDKYEFVRHQSGTRMDNAAMADLSRGMMASDAMKVSWIEHQTTIWGSWVRNLSGAPIYHKIQ